MLQFCFVFVVCLKVEIDSVHPHREITVNPTTSLCSLVLTPRLTEVLLTVTTWVLNLTALTLNFKVENIPQKENKHASRAFRFYLARAEE